MHRFVPGVVLRGLLMGVFGYLALATVVQAGALAAEAVRFLPVDEAAQVPEFFAFRAKLQAAIACRDIETIKGALQRDVKLSFGDENGVEAFDRIWEPSSPQSPLWKTLGTTLALGGTFDADGSFTAPYVFTTWPEDYDPFEYAAILDPAVPVRSAADFKSPLLTRLEFTIVKKADTMSPEEGWTKITLSDGRFGYVETSHLRSPLDHRIRFAKVEGKWQVVFFLAGD